MKKQDLQKFVVEYQLVDQQIKVLQQQLVLLEQQATETAALIDNLESLKNVKARTKAFAQLGPGMSVETTVNEPSHVLVNVGANTIVKKTLPEAQNMLHTQIEEIKKITEKMHAEIQRLLGHAQQLRHEIQKVSA